MPWMTSVTMSGSPPTNVGPSMSGGQFPSILVVVLFSQPNVGWPTSQSTRFPCCVGGFGAPSPAEPKQSFNKVGGRGEPDTGAFLKHDLLHRREIPSQFNTNCFLLKLFCFTNTLLT